VRRAKFQKEDEEREEESKECAGMEERKVPKRAPRFLHLPSIPPHSFLPND
jgi:hypothetical protein